MDVEIGFPELNFRIHFTFDQKNGLSFQTAHFSRNDDS